MHHLLNCHGEWAAIAATFTSLTTLKLYWNSWRVKKNENQDQKITS